ncbi:MAG: hypothetical protein V4535_08915, partial [Bacteroidota bacterium]
MKIKKLVVILFLACYSINAQRTLIPSETLKIEGKIKAGTTFTMGDLEMFQKVDISDQKLYNQRGEP